MNQGAQVLSTAGGALAEQPRAEECDPDRCGVLEEDGVGGGAHEKGGTKRACIANIICLSADHRTLDR